MTSYRALAAWLIFLLSGQLLSADENQGMVSSGISHRVLTRFDFNERAGGNFETIPRGWAPIAGPGYPRFTEPRFDNRVGHDAAPSFRFDLTSGNVGAAYINESINIHPDSDYEVSAWIRTSGLRFASASISAVLLDHSLNEIKDSHCKSAALSGGEGGEWRLVRLTVRGGCPKARWLGLYCDVEQEHSNNSGLRPIERQDVHGTVWFDDICVTRLPHVELELRKASGIFVGQEAPQCRITIRDIDPVDLSCSLVVRDGDGRAVVDRILNGAEGCEAEKWLDVGPLNMGWYEAVLDVRSHDQSIVQQRRSFVRLPAGVRGESTQKGFGLICDAFKAGQAPLLSELMSVLQPAVVKLPVWSKGLTDDEIVKGSPEFYGFLGDLNARGIGAVGVLADVPECLAKVWRQSQSIGMGLSCSGVETILASPPELWRAYAALPMTRYGRFFDAWQVGGDLNPDIDANLQVKALNAIRGEFPNLKICPAPRDEIEAMENDKTPKTGPRLERISTAMSASHLLAEVGCKARPAVRWVTVDPITGADGITRRAEYAQKLLLSRFVGAALTFSRQPWRIERQGQAWVALPDEEYVMLHTLGQTLSGLTPVQQLKTQSNVVALLWSDPTRRNAVITAWTPGDGADTEWTIDAGHACRVIDIWGNARDASDKVHLGAIPTIISNVLTDRVLLSCGLSAEPSVLMPGLDQPCHITIQNPRKDAWRGELELELPARWHVNPSRASLDVPPGGKFETDVSIRVPINEPSRELTLAAQYQRMGDAMHGLTLRTPVRVGSQGVDVNVMTRLEDGGLRIFQRVSSLLDAPIRLQSFVVGDGKRLQGGVFELPARQSVVREYLLDRQILSQDVPIRVSLEQIGGTIRDNRLIATR